MTNILLVALGGSLGAVSRYLIKVGLASFTSTSIIATFSVNALGCLLAGLLIGWGLEKNIFWLQPILIVGFLGSFTTFSAFALDVNELMSQSLFNALIYILATTIICVLFCFLGLKIGSYLL